jgi:helix-turn-helix protein
MPRQIDPDLLTAQQVIDRLVDRPSLRKKALTCILPAVKHGNQWRFRQRDLDLWIQAQEQPAGEC